MQPISIYFTDRAIELQSYLATKVLSSDSPEGVWVGIMTSNRSFTVGELHGASCAAM